MYFPYNYYKIFVLHYFLLHRLLSKGGYYMKKFTTTLVILIALILSTSIVALASDNATYKEGIYTLADFAPTKDNLYTIRNISSEDNSYLIVMDENLTSLQFLRLEPKSPIHDLIPLSPKYRIVIFGAGEVLIKPAK